MNAGGAQAVVETPVLIVGGGPVGLTLAVDLGRRGVRCMLVDRRPRPAWLPKMERCNGRTMEHYRRLGIAERIRDAGYDRELPMDVFITTSLAGPVVAHHRHPSVAQAQAARGPNDGSRPCEPSQIISQYTLEPLLKRVAEAMPEVDVRFGEELIWFEQRRDGVLAHLERSDGTRVTVRAAYLVGCDGGGSAVRKDIGARLEGDSRVRVLFQGLFRSDDLYERIPIGRGRHYHIADDRWTFLIVQDDCRHFTLHSVVPDAEALVARFRELMPDGVGFETLYVGQWTMRLMLADRYASGRVFLAGDAVHLVTPNGGLGMNTGVGDAIDLAWKLAATLQGWGGPGLLAAYEPERRPVGERNVGASRESERARAVWRGAYRPDLSAATAAGERARREMARLTATERRKSRGGTELGYAYDGSPLVCSAGERPIGASDPFSYVPSARPGARLPNVWLGHDDAVQDHLGLGYTVLRLRPGIGTTALERGFERYGAPLSVVDISSETARRVYGADVLLLRPDLHVAWRSNDAPRDGDAIASVALGMPA